MKVLGLPPGTPCGPGVSASSEHALLNDLASTRFDPVGSSDLALRDQFQHNILLNLPSRRHRKLINKEPFFRCLLRRQIRSAVLMKIIHQRRIAKVFG